MSNLKITTNIIPSQILSNRGMGTSNGVNILIAETVQRLCDPYIPMSAGSGAHMKAQYDIASDGSTITYPGPYAHFQYTGKVMVGSDGSPWAAKGETKSYINQELEYNDSPMRGKEWNVRMMADKGDEVTAAVATYVGGKAK